MRHLWFCAASASVLTFIPSSMFAEAGHVLADHARPPSLAVDSHQLVVRAALPIAHPVRGQVRDSTSGVPLARARVVLAGTDFATTARDDGIFVFDDVPAGEYQLRATQVGYRPGAVLTVHVHGTANAPVLILLARLPQPLGTTIVTPGYFGVVGGGSATPQTMTRAQIAAVPQIGEDIYRAVAHLPGIAADEYSAGFAVHGFGPDELYVTLDGLELVEPFHLKDVRGGALSVIDADAIGSVELTTTGYSAEYGDRLGGVFTMRSVDARRDRPRTTLGVSVMNARAMSQGGFADERGSWLVSGRRGYLDLALRATTLIDSLRPRYGDLFAKVTYDVPRWGQVAAHVLSAGDDFLYRDASDGSLASRYGSRYGWVTWDSPSDTRFTQRTVLSVGRLTWRRDAQELDELTRGVTRVRAEVADRRSDEAVGFRQDWSFIGGTRSVLKWGADIRRESASLDYVRWTRHARLSALGTPDVTHDSVQAVVAERGTRTAAYVAERVRLGTAVTAELGVRYDHQSVTGEAMASPRVNVAWQLREGTTVRGAWGRYAQTEPLYALQVQDGESTSARADRSEQHVIGLEQRFPAGVSVRINAYHQQVDPRRARWMNVGGELDLLPEASWDRVRVAPASNRSRGLETLIARNGGRRVDWSAGYALASATDLIDARSVPRSTDQRHTVQVLWALHPASDRWRLSMSSVWHSGQPYTPQGVRVDTVATPPSLEVETTAFARELNVGRLPAYSRVDARWTQYFDTPHGRVALFAELFNVLNAKNVRSYANDVSITGGRQVTIVPTRETTLPRLPTLGLSWEF